MQKGSCLNRKRNERTGRGDRVFERRDVNAVTKETPSPSVANSEEYTRAYAILEPKDKGS